MHHWQKISLVLMLYDIVAVNAAYFLALWIRFDFHYLSIEEKYIDIYMKYAIPYTIICLIVFRLLKLYHSMWRFASYTELIRGGMACLITGILQVVFYFATGDRMPISYYLLGMILQTIFIVGSRFSYRFILLEKDRRMHEKRSEEAKRVMLIGAGTAGKTILQELKKSTHVNCKVCCIIDDNTNKWNRYIEDIPIIGGREDILKAAKDYAIDEIYLTMPGAKREERRDILNICKETGCRLMNLPGVYQLVNGEISIAAMKEVNIEDLLGREPIKVDLREIFDYLKGKVVMVTGGGGSIGSELSRQIAGHAPKQLIIFDVYENNAYAIEQELRKKYPDLNLVVLIGSVRDSRKMNHVFKTYHPDVVYHAAAHKHVPLMEGSPCEAIKNNVMGTYKTAWAALHNGCERFVLISTDKAVNPTNIMGASKRLCEMVIQSFAFMVKQGRASEIPERFTHKPVKDEACETSKASNTEFVAVRFGNVLGSNGSVIPLFKKQIAAGGPVTVTHPDIIRYFMTIPEAVSLVLQAGTFAKGGEIFVLDMGAPVKIDTLARNLIKLSGHRPDEDIDIVYTGLRPGEKLYEETLMKEEGLGTTRNDLIHVGRPIAFDEDVFLKSLDGLFKASYRNEKDIREYVRKIVPTYTPAGKHGTEKKGEAYKALREKMAEKDEKAV